MPTLPSPLTLNVLKADEANSYPLMPDAFNISELIITFAYKRFLGYLVSDEFKPEGLMQILSTDYKIAVSFLILVLVLIIKPTGLFSGKTI